MVFADGRSARNVRWGPCSILAVAAYSIATGREAIGVWEATHVWRESANGSTAIEGSRSWRRLLLDLVNANRVGVCIHDEGKGESRENGKQLHDWSFVFGCVERKWCERFCEVS